MSESFIGFQVIRSLEHKIPPPILVPVIGAAMWAVAQLRPSLPIDRNLRLVAAMPFVLSGLSFLALGVLAFWKAKTTIDPVRIEAASSFVSDGVYRYTRNPMYVGFAGLLVGWALYLAVPYALFGPVGFTLFINLFQIIPEERVMSSKFGRDYDEYRKRVRRWL